MRPLIRPGTWMHVRFGDTSVAVGDIVVFALADALVAHRVIAMRPGGSAPTLLTKGDSRPTSDPPLGHGDVLGIVDALRSLPDSTPLTAGCSGRQARAIAAVSRWSERAGIRARRIARTLPDPLRRHGIAAATVLAGSASRAGATPATWLAARQSRRGGGR